MLIFPIGCFTVEFYFFCFLICVHFDFVALYLLFICFNFWLIYLIILSIL